MFRRSAARVLIALCTVLWAGALGCGKLGCGGHEPAGQASSAEPKPVPTVTLRFRPLDKLARREHWVYDVAVPGTGLGRNALTLDVSLLAKLDADSFAVREVVRSHAMFQDRKQVAAPTLAGAAITYSWGRDHSLISEITTDAATPVLAAAAKMVAQLARFGTLIEYPDQAVAVGDSWSIEPRQLLIAPGLEATLRPTYTLESLDAGVGLDRTVQVASDIQVDVVSFPIAEGITVEGGGTASGTLRVRLRDGSLDSARSVMHFSQEITVQGNEILGYREFSATAHMFGTAPGSGDPDLAAEPYTIEAPEHDRDCDLAVASTIERLKSAPGQRGLSPLPVRRGVNPPAVYAGEPLRAAGKTLVILPDPKHVELDGVLLELKDLPHALRNAAARGVLYVYADSQLSLERVRALGALLAIAHRLDDARLVVRDADHPLAAPKTLRWLDERLRIAALAANGIERNARLHELMMAHLALCEPAIAVYTNALAHEDAWPRLAGEILSKFLGCGCTATNLDGLETTLEALLGTPDLRSIPWPRAIDAALPDTASLSELARQLTAGARPHKP